VEEEEGVLTIEAEEEVLSKVDAIAVLEILVEEVQTQVPVNQVVRELTNQRFNAITVKVMEIMHIIAERDSIIRTSKVKISQAMLITKFILCLWRTL
jgi:hypothetical protein